MISFENDRRFSFLYDGKPFYELKTKLEIYKNGSETQYVYRLDDGLVFTHILREFSEFSAYEWVNYFEYDGDGSSGLIRRQHWISWLP